MIRENDPCDDIPVHIARSKWAGLMACGCPIGSGPRCRCVDASFVDAQQRSTLAPYTGDCGRWIERAPMAE